MARGGKQNDPPLARVGSADWSHNPLSLYNQAVCLKICTMSWHPKVNKLLTSSLFQKCSLDFHHGYNPHNSVLKLSHGTEA